MKKTFLALLMLLISSVARAQSSCDKPALSGTTNIFTTSFPFAVSIPAGITPTAFKITVNGTQSALATTVTTPASDGRQCFLVSVTVAANSTNTITTQYTPSGGTEVSSSPFVLSVVDPKPVNHPR